MQSLAKYRGVEVLYFLVFSFFVFILALFHAHRYLYY